MSWSDDWTKESYLRFKKGYEEGRLTEGEIEIFKEERARRNLPDLVIIDGVAKHRLKHLPDFNGDTRMFCPFFDEKALIGIFERMAELAKETGECLKLGIGSVGTYFEVRIYPGEDVKVLMNAYKKEMIHYDEREKEEHEWEIARYG